MDKIEKEIRKEVFRHDWEIEVVGGVANVDGEHKIVKKVVCKKCGISVNGLLDLLFTDIHSRYDKECDERVKSIYDITKKDK
uniref:Uncharacterized protein n=1 Tax=viral metagenome TaxID=1070528 RepID=A0A6M3LWE2_9ZZZZ